MSMNYGGNVFDEPTKVESWSTLHRAGLYAILIPDSRVSPKPFRVIYFGETDNLSKRDFVKTHQAYRNWISTAGSPNDLYIAVCPKPNSTAEQRMLFETQLIAKYDPICNRESDDLGL